MSRTIFPQVGLFKKTVTEQFIVCLREIFKQHPIYTYVNDPQSDEDVNIHIDTAYADRERGGKKPTLTARTGQYEFSLRDMLGGNYYEQVQNSLGVYGGNSSLKDMTTDLQLSVRAYSEEESSDLADEIAMLSVHAVKEMFTQVGLNIQGVRVAPTQLMDNSNDLFETQMSFSLRVPWKLERVDNEDAYQGEIETEHPQSSEGMMPPQVNVFKSNK